MSYPNKQSDAEHSNWNSCQVITPKRGNLSNSLDFKKVYFLYRLTEKNGETANSIQKVEFTTQLAQNAIIK